MLCAKQNYAGNSHDREKVPKKLSKRQVNQQHSGNISTFSRLKAIISSMT